MTHRQLLLLLGYIRRRPLIYLPGFAASLVGVTFLALIPLGIRHLLDEALPAGLWLPIVLTVLGIAAAQFLHRGLVIVNRIFREIADVSMAHDIRRDLFARLLSQDGYFFDRNVTGDLVERLTGDLRQVTFAVQLLVLKGFLSTFEIIAPLVAAFVLNWRLALVLLAFAPTLYIMKRLVAPTMHAANAADRAHAARTREYVHEALEGARMIRSIQAQDPALARLRDLNHRRLEEGSFRVAFTAAAARNLWSFVRAFGILAVFAIAVVEVQAGRATPGMVAAFVQIALTYFGGLGYSSDYLADYERVAAPWRRIAPLLDEQPRVAEGRERVRLSAADASVQFANVSFRYADDRLEPIRNVSLDVQPGEFVGIVGPTGSGKTTLADLVLRHYDADAGGIHIAGHDIRSLLFSDLRRDVGIVPQDAVLLNASIRENLQVARPEARDADLIAAMRHADLHDYVASLPDGYDTVVGDRGVRLSGGQRQRVAIARVFLQDPPILLLDEATASLDAITEEHIQTALARVRASRTVIAIAHRLATLRDADRIVVIDDGRVVESGAPHQLLERRGLYWQLHATQFGAGAQTA
ncbi:MAG: ABC transporter ATP-binding protein [Chloroflexi bacterium]|nr:ABC transporter ATP-binding protein [Chloroflexota bacterium]